MTKDLTKEQQDFVDKTNKHRQEKIEELAYKVLAEALREDIPVFELPYYVLQRTRTVISDAFNKVNFSNPKIIAARKKFLTECLAEMRKKVEPAKKKEEKDETDVRDNKCEPVVQGLVALLLDDALIFSDEYFFDKVLVAEEGIPLNAAISGYANVLDEKLLMIISEHWRKATEKMFGVEKEKLTFTALDEILKRA